MILAAAALGISGSIGGVVLLWPQLRRQSYVEMKNVSVLDRLSDYDMRMQVTDPDTGQPVEFVAQFCHDYKPTDEIQRGVTLNLLKFVDNGKCYEILPENLGYVLKRDSQGNPIVSNN